ncbi:MAG: aldose 1-epimerase family protein [Planctomycetes bacterium]|nr:aldose 1-epimerase family protein [Planctomycetota bacterium]
MQISLECGKWKASINTLGAELDRLYDGEAGEEILWQGDPDIWDGTAPILFPIVGRLLNGQYRYGGNSYCMEKHGIARKSEFDVIDQTSNSVTMRLCSTEKSLEVYPFKFELDVTFILSQSMVSVDYVARNRGEGEMLFTIGSHPALNLHDSHAPYYIEFEKYESLDVYRIIGDLLETSGKPYLLNERRIELTPDRFDEGALVFKNIKSRKINVVGDGGEWIVSLDTSGAPHLGLWAMRGAPYVCIEPWFSYDDDAEVSGSLEDKPGIIKLAPSSEFTTGYTIAKEK